MKFGWIIWVLTFWMGNWYEIWISFFSCCHNEKVTSKLDTNCFQMNLVLRTLFKLGFKLHNIQQKISKSWIHIELLNLKVYFSMNNIFGGNWRLNIKMPFDMQFHWVKKEKKISFFWERLRGQVLWQFMRNEMTKVFFCRCLPIKEGLLITIGHKQIWRWIL